MPFIEDLSARLSAPQALIETETQRALVARAIADTIAVAAAGFAEPVTRNVLSAYGGAGPVAWSGEPCESLEAAILVNAVAAHALDFDDVYLESMAHISTVLVPVVLTGPDDDMAMVADAYAAGLIAARAVACRIGQGHYARGWHGTATIGTFAAAAAAARLRGLSQEQVANALGLAASLAGGLKVQFATQAKPAHAGFAAAAGYRAARLAAAGVDASRRVFDAEAYPGLYGTGDGLAVPGPDAFALRPDRLSVKLFPCCYATHRMVQAALDLRTQIGPEGPDGRHYRLEVPAGALDALPHARPTDPLQAKFSAQYCVAAALAHGPLTLAEFTPPAVSDPRIARILDRLDVFEDPTQPDGQDISAGEVRLIVDPGHPTETRVTVRNLPGSPEAPPRLELLQAKNHACFELFRAAFGNAFPLRESHERLGVSLWWDHPGATEEISRPCSHS